MKEDHKVVITHGDLRLRNIMVTWNGLLSTDYGSDQVSTSSNSDIRITAIIDWEMYGYYPEYWEYIKALNTIGPKDPLFDWCDYLPIAAIGQWPVEYAIDLLISRWLG